jgi:hypothetical protein
MESIPRYQSREEPDSVYERDDDVWDVDIRIAGNVHDGYVVWDATAEVSEDCPCSAHTVDAVRKMLDRYEQGD